MCRSLPKFKNQNMPSPSRILSLLSATMAALTTLASTADNNSSSAPLIIPTCREQQCWDATRGMCIDFLHRCALPSTNVTFDLSQLGTDGSEACGSLQKMLTDGMQFAPACATGAFGSDLSDCSGSNITSSTSSPSPLSLCPLPSNETAVWCVDDDKCKSALGKTTDAHTIKKGDSCDSLYSVFSSLADKSSVEFLTAHGLAQALPGKCVGGAITDLAPGSGGQSGASSKEGQN